MGAERQRRGKDKPFVLGYADGTILKALLRYHYLTSEQVRRLYYSAGSLTYVQTRLSRLVAAGYCIATTLPKPTPGKPPSVFGLNTKGLRHLAEAGFEVPARFRPSEAREHDYLQLRHTLAANDVLIAVELFCRDHPSISLAELRSERTLKYRPMSVPTRDGGKLGVIFDGWVDLRVHPESGQGYRTCIAFEVDRGTEEQRRWRQKVANIVATMQGAYAETFGTTSLTIAVVATTGEKRLADLLSWTEAALVSQAQQRQGEYFLFAHLEPAAVEPDKLLASPCWRQPFRRGMIPLLEIAGVHNLLPSTEQ